MDYYCKDEALRCIFHDDWWEPYQGKYPHPTYFEYGLIRPFLHKFALEDDNFVEEEDQRWMFFKNHLGSPPDLRSQLIRFLTQVRATKGYDVDTYFDFSVVSAWGKLHVFVPRSLDNQEFYRQAMAASEFAVRKINAYWCINYEVVRVEKLVSTTTNKFNKLLVTFTAKEIATANLEIFQAVLYPPTDDNATFELIEWKFKPIPF